MDALIIGGNRFFGKRLGHQLLQAGHRVTILNRGHLDDGLGTKIFRLQADRRDRYALEEKTAGCRWDVIFDQVCMDARDAELACEVFAKKTKRYIFTSTLSVYDWGANLNEENFVATNYGFKKYVSSQENYQEAKRQAETVFAQKAPFPVVTARFPIVLGEDDYTERLLFHVRKVKNEEPIYFPNLDAKLGYISSEDAARSLAFLGGHNYSGPVNCASSEVLSLREFMELIAKVVGKPPYFVKDGSVQKVSPFGIPKDWYMDVSRLRELGFSPTPLLDWLPQLLKALANKG